MIAFFVVVVKTTSDGRLHKRFDPNRQTPFRAAILSHSSRMTSAEWKGPIDLSSAGWNSVPVKGKTESKKAASSAAAPSLTRAIKRIAQDLRELIEFPVANVNAAPIDDSNLLVWHGSGELRCSFWVVLCG